MNERIPLPTRLRRLLPFGVLPVTAACALSSSCYTQGETTCAQENEPLVPLRGKLLAQVGLRDDAGALKRLRLEPLEAGAEPAPSPEPLDEGSIVVVDPAVAPGPGLKYAIPVDPGGAVRRYVVVRDEVAGELVPIDVTGARLYPWIEYQNPVVMRAPQAGSTVAVELCQLYGGNPDPSQGHPNYRDAAITDDAGTFELMVPKGKVGIHTFAEGFLYGRTEVADVPDRNAEAPWFVEDLARRVRPPVLSNFRVRPSEVGPGQTLTFTLTTRAALPDPMSEEVVVYEPTTHDSRAFAPPRRGIPKVGWPDGTWTASMPAPRVPGRYTYYAHSTSEYCVSSNRLSLEVLVR